jgi:flagellar motor switch protein FliN/FliY
MPRDAATLMKLRVPVIVRLGHRAMKLDDVISLGPGAIIELPQQADSPLDLMVANKVIGQGVAVKIGENFGIKMTALGSPRELASALGPS